jgi:hypothetical protein
MTTDDRWFERLVDREASETSVAPARLKSKVYSALVARMAESGPLLDLNATKHAGGHLCVFEHALAVLPAGTSAGSMNPCRICHARVLAERLRRAPIFWPGCPYAEFHHG